MKNKLVKRWTVLALMSGMVLAAAGCSDKDKNSEANGNTNTSTDDRTTFEILSELDINEYITLGQYKELELEKKVAAVTEKEIEDEIEAALEAYPAKVTDRTDVRDGDIANIDFVGRMDGETFDGGTSEAFDLTIGSGSFIDGFEDGLIGANVGDTVVLDLHFPDPYKNNPDFAGKAVEFTVTINAIKAPLEEATDEWVAESIETCKTVEEYKETLRKMLAEVNEATAEEQLLYSAWTEVVEGTTIHKYPDILVERGAELYREQVEYYAQYSSMELEDYVEYCGATMEEFEQYAEDYGQSIAAQGMINYAICQLENIEIGGDVYKAGLEELLEKYECTEEELNKYYNRDDIEQTVLLNCVCDVILEQAKVTEVQSSDDAE